LHLEREENEDVVERAVPELSSLRLIQQSRTTQPWRDSVDGAFAAKLVREV
jgi:16S rRNA C967 or C1407 C5-methylase (RsmB/RsmF family)